jgi:signal transduction histidine kinase
MTTTTDQATRTTFTDELAVFTRREMGRTALQIARFRIVFVPVMATAMLLLVLLEPTAWRLWLLGGAFAIVFAIILRDFFHLRVQEFSPWHVPYAIATVLIFHSALIAVTGGVESPFYVLLVIMGLIPALTLGSVRPFVALAALPVSLIWFFAIGGVTGGLEGLTPRFWGEGLGYHRNPVYTYTKATVFTVATVAGGTITLFIRAALDRMLVTAARTRHELLQSLQARNEELVSLSGALAHELKNPLASIQGLASVLARKQPEGSREAEQMTVLLGEVKRMGAILDEFLNFSRPVTSLAARPVHPAELLADVVLLHEGLAHQKGVVLVVDPGDGSPITCDPRKVKQVLVNLLQNALDATPRGGSVAARTEHTAAGVRFLVDDSGSGLADEVRGRLFTPGATTKAAGSGLGLTIARAIAEQHGGSLTLEERPQGGCRAVLVLPREAPAPAAAVEVPA